MDCDKVVRFWIIRIESYPGWLYRDRQGEFGLPGSSGVPETIVSYYDLATKPLSNRAHRLYKCQMQGYFMGWRGVTASCGHLVVLSSYAYGRGTLYSQTCWPARGDNRVKANDLSIRDLPLSRERIYFTLKVTWFSRCIFRSIIFDPS